MCCYWKLCRCRHRLGLGDSRRVTRFLLSLIIPLHSAIIEVLMTDRVNCIYIYTFLLFKVPIILMSFPIVGVTLDVPYLVLSITRSTSRNNRPAGDDFNSFLSLHSRSFEWGTRTFFPMECLFITWVQNPIPSLTASTEASIKHSACHYPVIRILHSLYLFCSRRWAETRKGS